MAKSWSLRVGAISLTSGAATGPASVDAQTPFRILVLGDFSGQGRKPGRRPLGQRQAVLVDRDNLDTLLAKTGAEVSVCSAVEPQEQVAISFRDMEDFEPDRLFQRLGVFEALGNLRQRLRDPAQFAAAAAEIKQWASAGKIPDAPPSPRKTCSSRSWRSTAALLSRRRLAE
jgi:type VI secretion system protein ImpC